MEVWKSPKDFEGMYEVSSQGRVRGLDRIIVCKNGNKRKVIGKNLTPFNNSEGNLSVAFSLNGKPHLFTVTNLVNSLFDEEGLEKMDWKQNISYHNLAKSKQEKLATIELGSNEKQTKIEFDTIESLMKEVGMTDASDNKKTKPAIDFFLLDTFEISDDVLFGDKDIEFIAHHLSKREYNLAVRLGVYIHKLQSVTNEITRHFNKKFGDQTYEYSRDLVSGLAFNRFMESKNKITRNLADSKSEIAKICTKLNINGEDFRRILKNAPFEDNVSHEMSLIREINQILYIKDKKTWDK